MGRARGGSCRAGGPCGCAGRCAGRTSSRRRRRCSGARRQDRDGHRAVSSRSGVRRPSAQGCSSPARVPRCQFCAQLDPSRGAWRDGRASGPGGPRDLPGSPGAPPARCDACAGSPPPGNARSNRHGPGHRTGIRGRSPGIDGIAARGGFPRPLALAAGRELDQAPERVDALDIGRRPPPIGAPSSHAWGPTLFLQRLKSYRLEAASPVSGVRPRTRRGHSATDLAGHRQKRKRGRSARRPRR